MRSMTANTKRSFQAGNCKIERKWEAEGSTLEGLRSTTRRLHNNGPHAWPSWLADIEGGQVTAVWRS
jgi:hypothetical protein